MEALLIAVARWRRRTACGDLGRRGAGVAGGRCDAGIARGLTRPAGARIHGADVVRDGSGFRPASGSCACPGSIRCRPSRLVAATAVAACASCCVARWSWPRSWCRWCCWSRRRCLSAVWPGFRTSTWVSTRIACCSFVSPPSAGNQPVSNEERRQLYRRLLDRAERVPGVEAASASFSGVFSRETWGNAIAVEGVQPPTGETLENVRQRDHAPLLRRHADRGAPRPWLRAAGRREPGRRWPWSTRPSPGGSSARPIRSASGSRSARAIHAAR